MRHNTEEEQAFDVPQLSKRWNVQCETLYDQIAVGAIPAFKIGRVWRIKRETVEAIEAGQQQ